MQRSNSLIRLLGRVPWASNEEDYYSSSAEEEPVAPPSPAVSQEDAKAREAFSVCGVAAWKSALSLLCFFCQLWVIPSGVCVQLMWRTRESALRSKLPSLRRMMYKCGLDDVISAQSVRSTQ